MTNIWSTVFHTQPVEEVQTVVHPHWPSEKLSDTAVKQKWLNIVLQSRRYVF